MIRVNKDIWIKISAVEEVKIVDSQVIINGQCIIQKEFLVDALTALNIKVGDVLARVKNETST